MHGRTADAAFLPLDPRLGEYFYLGIDDFMKEVDAKHIFPMHFWGEYDVAERLKQLPCSAGYRDRVVGSMKREKAGRYRNSRVVDSASEFNDSGVEKDTGKYEY